MLRRPKLRRRARVAHDVERIGECDEAMTNVAFQVVRDDVLASTRDEDARRGFTLRRSVEAQGRGMERAKRRIGKFLARLDGTKLDGANIKEQLERAKARTSAVLKDIKVPKVEDLKNLIDDIREEQTLAQYHPDRKRLSSVADFFIYTEEEGRKFFEEVDRSGKNKVTLDDLKIVMKKRNLPPSYARAFMDKAKGNKIFARTITWEDFKNVMNERESTMLRTFNSMTMSRSGMLKISDVKSALGRLGLAATDENAAAMLKHLRGSAEYSRQGYVTYGQFRNFLMLLPPEVASATDPSRLWFEAATIVQFSPPQRSGNFKLAAKAALAGGLASATTTTMMHPLDTLKTRLQAAVGKGPSLLDLIKSVPKLGPRKMYQGIIPAVTGSFVGHGLRTATFEVVCKVLAPAVVLPFVTETAIQGVGSGVGTLLGTCVRIPCEVLKQRLQTDQYSNVISAFKGITAVTPRALFAGTAATLTREIPFYVTGLMIYQNLKKGAVAINGGRELENYQVIMVGACAGALGSVMVNPFDVMKTRTMTGSVPYGQSLWVSMAYVVKTEGALALMKGAIPRMAWIAPLGAMNFSGYELAKKAMMKEELAAQKELMNVPAVRARPPDVGSGEDEKKN